MNRRCAATLRITRSASPAERAGLRDQLLAFAASHLTHPATVGDALPTWKVDAPSDDLLRISLLAPSRKRGVARVLEIADGFQQHLTDVAVLDCATPTSEEVWLAQQADQLRMRVEVARLAVDAASAAIPTADPTKGRSQELTQWQALRGQFASSRNELAAAARNSTTLRSDPDPTLGVVSGDARREAYEADAALQQDLRELTVFLAELKRELTRVRASTKPALDRLVGAAEGLGTLVASRSNDLDKTAVAVAATIPRELSKATTTFVAEVRAFQSQWAGAFALLNSATDDPLSKVIPSSLLEARRHRGDFLFSAEGLLSKIRTATRDAGVNGTDSARHHVFQSDLIRALELAQAAFSRFALVSDSIETSRNFRLDAAWRGASGIQRRSLARAGAIEKNLEAAALVQAKLDHAEAIAKSESHTRRLRSTLNQTVDELLALQTQLNQNADLSEDFLRAVLSAEIATARLDLTREDLAGVTKSLDGLAAKRLATTTDPGVRTISSGVVGWPADLPKRLAIAALASGITLITTLLGRSRAAARNIPRTS